MSGADRYPAQYFTQLLDCPNTYTANDIIQVNSVGTGLIETPASSLIPPVIGTGTMNDIPVFSGGLPIFVDSGFQVGNISVPNPPEPLDLQAHYINLKPSAGIDQIIASVHDPNTGDDLVFIGVGAITGDANLQITNQSTAPGKNLGLSNSSPTGQTYMTGDACIMNNNNSISMEVNQTGLGLFDGLNNNYYNSNNTGVNISSSTDVTLYDNADNVGIFLNNTGLMLYAGNVGTNINLNAYGAVNISANNNDININTPNNLHIEANSSTGQAGQVLTADGASNCNWKTPLTLNMVNCASTSVPAGLSWVAYSGAIPFNDSSLSYGGYQNQLGTNVSYDNSTHIFTVVNSGWFNVRCSQSVNTNASYGAVVSDGRIALYTYPGLVQVGSNSDRFQVPAGLSAVSLSFQLYLDVVVYLLAGQYQVWATGEPEGLLLGKNSCTFQQLA